MSTTETLTAELNALCAREGLPHECAYELSIGPSLAEPQRQWLVDFCKRWDEAESARSRLER